MKNADSNHPKTGAEQSRRGFLKATTFAAAGIVLTPLITACGGEEEAPAKPKKKTTPAGGGSKTETPSTPTPAPSGGGAYELVDSADKLGDTGTVKFSTEAAGEEDLGYVKLEATDTDMALAQTMNGGKGPWEERGKRVKAGSGVGNVIFWLVPAAGSKALKNSSESNGANWHFRFTNAVSVGVKMNINYVIGDGVSHNVKLVDKQGNPKGEKSGVRLPGKDPETASLPAPSTEGLYFVSCTMHKWENAYVLVSKHAYVAITGNRLDGAEHHEGRSFVQAKDLAGKELLDGTCFMTNVPVGKHKVRIFQNGKELTDKSFEVEVKKGETTNAPALKV